MYFLVLSFSTLLLTVNVNAINAVPGPPLKGGTLGPPAYFTCPTPIGADAPIRMGGCRPEQECTPTEKAAEAACLAAGYKAIVTRHTCAIDPKDLNVSFLPLIFIGNTGFRPGLQPPLFLLVEGSRLEYRGRLIRASRKTSGVGLVVGRNRRWGGTGLGSLREYFCFRSLGSLCTDHPSDTYLALTPGYFVGDFVSEEDFHTLTSPTQCLLPYPHRSDHPSRSRPRPTSSMGA